MKRLVLAIALLLASCQQQTPTAVAPSPVTPSVAASPVVSGDDPAIAKSRLEAKIDEEVAAISPKLQQPQTREISDGKTFTYKAEYKSTSYDIKKTDSIVTPYTGIVRYYLDWYANGELVPAESYIEATYAYQDGQWVFKDAIRHIGGRVNDDPEDIAWVKSLF